jgi:integrase
MSIFRRGRHYWYEFIYKGQRYCKSTRQRNYQAAVDIESARRTQLAKGDADLEPRPPAPTLKEFEKTFVAWVERDKKNVRTQRFYKTNFVRLLAFRPFAGARLNQIDEPMIERFKAKMDADGISKTTVNRYLSTLRKALRYAVLSLKLFDKLPRIILYTKDDGAEREREFIFSDTDYRNWVAASPEPLRSASVLARESGICRSELLALERDCVILTRDVDDKGLYGYLDVRRGLKRKNRKRKLPITPQMRLVILPLLDQSRCKFLFTSVSDLTQPLSPWTLEDQLGRTRTLLRLDPDAGLHTLRHTFLTEKGRTTDAFTLQKIAGHSNIATTMKYVHVQQAAIEDAFAIRKETVPTKSTTIERSTEENDVYN